MDYWEALYNFFGIKDLIYSISSPQLQDYLFPVKIIFILFSAFFLIGIIYFMANSSWLRYKFLEDTVEFFSWQSFGAREISKQWGKIKKRLESGVESDLKLAVIEAEDFLTEILEDRGYEADTFEESLKKAARFLEPMLYDILSSHKIRNSIVYDPDVKISKEGAKKIVDMYEAAVNRIGKI